ANAGLDLAGQPYERMQALMTEGYGQLRWDPSLLIGLLLSAPDERFGLTPEEGKLLEIPEGCRRIGTPFTQAFEHLPGFGQLALSGVGQGQVGPVGWNLHVLRGGDSFLDPGNRFLRAAGAEQKAAEDIPKGVPP